MAGKRTSKITKNPKIKLSSGWAVVSPKGRVQVDTICKDRESAGNFLSLDDEAQGCKIRRVTVVYTMRVST